jgi:DNA-binding response OmpR family regulator
MGSVRILLVDDEAEFVEALSARLDARGFACDTATSGDEALSKLAGDEYDVIVLDLKMPGKDGLETLVEIKAQKPLTEVIILTGKGTEEAAITAMLKGAFDFLAKPPDLNDLIQKIHQANARKAEHLDRINRASSPGDGDPGRTEEEPLSAHSLEALHGATAEGEHHGRLIVMGQESEFSKPLIEYALDMAERFSYAVVAVNAAGFAPGTFKSFPEAKERARREFRTASEIGAAPFREAATKRSVPFAHIVRYEDEDGAIRAIQQEVGEVEFVVSEPADGLVSADSSSAPNIVVYSIV